MTMCIKCSNYFSAVINCLLLALIGLLVYIFQMKIGFTIIQFMIIIIDYVDQPGKLLLLLFSVSVHSLQHIYFNQL